MNQQENNMENPIALDAASQAKQNQARLDYIGNTVLCGVNEVFNDNPSLRSATLLVSQYWDDEAADAVHSSLVFSVLGTPDLDAHFDAAVFDEARDDYGVDAVNLANVADFDLWAYWQRLSWDDNNEAIPLFAAFCVAGSQDLSSLENCRPFCIFRRLDDGSTVIDVVGEMVRPWLDGVASEEEA